MSSKTEVVREFKTNTVASAATAVGAFKNLHGSSKHLIQISGLTVETIALKVSADGTNLSAAVKPIDVTTNAVVAAATLGNGFYFLEWPTTILDFTKSAGAETVTIRTLSN